MADPNFYLTDPFGNSPSPTEASPVGPSTQAPAQAQAPSAVSQVKGPFGTHGTLGGILGVLGDVVLSSAGLQPQYLPKLQEAREADAVSNAQNDPVGAYQNLVKVSGVSAADQWLGGQIRNQYTAQQAKNAQQTANIQARQAPITAQEGVAKVIAPLYGFANNATDATAGPISSLIKSKLAAIGENPDDWNVPTDAEGLKAWAKNGISPEQAQTAADRQAQNAETNDIRRESIAERSQAAAQASADRAAALAARSDRPATRETVFGSVLDKVRSGQPLTPGEQKIFDTLKPGAGRKQSAAEAIQAAGIPTTNGAPSGGGSGKLVIRNGKPVRL